MVICKENERSDDGTSTTISYSKNYGKTFPVHLQKSFRTLKRGRETIYEDLSDNEYDDNANTHYDTLCVDNVIDLDHDFDAKPGEKPKELEKVQLTDDDESENIVNATAEKADIISDADLKLMKMYRMSQSSVIPQPKRKKLGQFTSSEHEISKYNHSLKVRKQYIERYNIPPPMFLEELERRVLKHIPICNSILTGKVSSLYYTQAKQVQNESSRDILTTEELRSLDMHNFTAGYFGLRRQGIVGMLILEKFGEYLAANKNPVVRFWGTYDFAYYVLAPELLCYLCMEDFNLQDLEDAWDLMQSTTEFGTVVADNDPLEPFEVEMEEKMLKKLNLGADYFSATYRKLQRRSLDNEVVSYPNH